MVATSRPAAGPLHDESLTDGEDLRPSRAHEPTGTERVIVLDGDETKQANLGGLAFDDSTASLLTSRILAGVAIARPIDRDASALFADVPDTAGGAPFDVLIVATSTADRTNLTAGGITTLIANAGGAPIAAGGLPAGRIATIAYSVQGGAFILKSLRDVAGQDAINLSLTASGLLAGVPVAFRTGSADLRAEVPDAASGSSFDILLVTTNALANTYLTAGGVTGLIANGGGVPIPPNGLPAGKIATIAYSVQGGAFILNGLRDVAGQIAINDSVKAAGLLAGVPVAVRTAKAELRAEVTNAANGNAFDILLVASNTTASTYLTAGGITRLIVNGGGNPIAAGGLPAGKIATIAYSLQGGAFVLNGLRFPSGTNFFDGRRDLYDPPMGKHHIPRRHLFDHRREKGTGCLRQLECEHRLCTGRAIAGERRRECAQ